MASTTRKAPWFNLRAADKAYIEAVDAAGDVFAEAVGPGGSAHGGDGYVELKAFAVAVATARKVHAEAVLAAEKVYAEIRASARKAHGEASHD